ncbi:hypothetical protein [Microcystis sp. M061S2]|uniref:hypothetical protein n=1 Tax=Microcystis sp. M061S2 TaxID=2771171 RepID=UPI00258C7EE8|nr:hypothetical protein [Microcystis sp. M061S2]MCA2653024.1 hypothetical protein [Microcystis sp. M061S2]
MKCNTNRSLLSRVSPKNPYDATGLSDRTPTNQNKSAISSLSVNFGNLSQNSLNFAARVSLATAQKSDIHQKTTANKARRGFVLS